MDLEHNYTLNVIIIIHLVIRLQTNYYLVITHKKYKDKDIILSL